MADCGDGGSFKKGVFGTLSNHITPLLTSGPAKNAIHCRTKYNVVSKNFEVSSLNTDIIHSSKPFFDHS